MTGAILRRRRLLSIGHSYVVGLNRRLPAEIARLGWDVSVVAPSTFAGDLRMASLEPEPGEPCRLEAVATRLSRCPHLMSYERRLRRLLRGHWDLIHCWEEPYVVAGGQVAMWAPPAVPLVFSTFQNLAKRYPFPFAAIERYCSRRADGWVAFGQEAERVLHRKSLAGARPTRVIPPGVDVELFRPDRVRGRAVRQRFEWCDPWPPVVAYVGRFVPEKGLGLLMAALDGLPIPWRGLFVGGGPMERALRLWSERWPGRIRIVTGAEHAHVPDYLNAADVVCVPSQTCPHWCEQFGRIIIEAFACGVPVVASDSGEIPHVLADAGVLLPERDLAAWRRGLELVLGSPFWRAELAARGLRRARDEFTWARVAQEHVDLFRELLERSGRRQIAS